MAQKTSLNVFATPGMVHSFSAKTEVTLEAIAPGKIFASGNKKHVFGAKDRKSVFPSSGIR